METKSSLPCSHVLRQTNPVHTTPSNFSKIRSPVCIPFLPMHVTYDAYTIFIDLINIILFGKEYKLWSPS
jgi:hypothetical protein